MRARPMRTGDDLDREESVFKLICGDHEYASVNRLDYNQLATARLKSAEM